MKNKTIMIFINLRIEGISSLNNINKQKLIVSLINCNSWTNINCCLLKGTYIYLFTGWLDNLYI